MDPFAFAAIKNWPNATDTPGGYSCPTTHRYGRVPGMDDLDSFALTHTLCMHIDKLPLLLHLCNCTSSLASVVQVRNPAMGDALRKAINVYSASDA